LISLARLMGYEELWKLATTTQSHFMFLRT